MSTSAIAVLDRRVALAVRARDYLELTKPRIAVLELVTVSVAAVVARRGAPDGWLLVHALVGTALVAASASAMNQWLERSSDARMPRTANRPLPAGRLSPREVVLFGLLTGVLGFAYLALLVNLLTALIGAATWILYVGVYTPLKRRSQINTAVGAVAGALPILMGWVAMGSHLGLEAWGLFLVVFLWQFPHFMAIAWIYRAQYRAAGLQMLPVVDPSGRRAGRQAVWAALALVPVSVLPTMVGIADARFFASALLLGICQLACALGFAWRTDETSARRLLHASLIYLPVLLLLLALGPFV